MIDLSKFDKSKFITKPFIKRVEKPWGYELIFTPPDLSYAGKLIHLEANKRLSLQVHDKKQESYFLYSGKCKLIADNQQGELIEIELKPQRGYTIAIGQRHRLHALTDSDIFEVSTPEIGTTHRLEDDYSRPDETEKMRKEERENS